MPRIQAATVAEHHAQQRRALLDAAREILAETGKVPAIGAVGKRAGLARTSVYQYFASGDELIGAVVGDVLPNWADQVRERVEAASTPGERVWAYVEANVDLFASSERAVAEALTRVVDPAQLRGPMEAFHAQLQVPLLEALTDFGEPEPQQMAKLVDSLIVHASREIDEAAKGVALARVRRLVAGYLDLSA